MIRHRRPVRSAPTPGTAPDLAAASALARRKFGVALMSDTKWRKLFKVLAELPPGQMLVKFIDVGEPRPMRYPTLLSLACPHGYIDTAEYGPVELRAIEWIEVDVDLAPTLAPIGHFPLERTDASTRVIGYR